MIIPYGATDDSIIYRSPLTSVAAVETPEIGSGTNIEVRTYSGSSGIVFDSELGALCGTAADSYFSGDILLQELTGYEALQQGGQISIEVESKYFAGIDDDGRYLSDRVNPEVYTALLSTQATGNTPYQRHYWNNVSQKMGFGSPINGGVISATFALPHPTNRFTTLTWSWHGKSNFFFFDGQLVMITGRNRGANIFNRIWLGSSRGLDTLINYCDHYMRNIQISTKPVMFPTKYNAKVAMAGDSMITQGRWREDASSIKLRYPSFNWVNPGYNNAIGHGRTFAVIDAYLNNKGFAVDLINHGVSGNTLAQLIARTSQILEDNPTYVIVQIGTNNSALDTETEWNDWETDYRSFIGTLLAHPSIQKIIVCTIPTIEASTILAANQPNIDQLNTRIKTFTDIENVIIADVESATPLGEYNYQEEVKAVDDSVHWATAGQINAGNVVAEALYSLL